MATSPVGGLKRRDELLGICARLFQARGFEATSMQDLADELGILKGSLYHYISSKDDLLYEIVHGVHVVAMKHLAACQRLDADAPEALAHFIRGHLEMISVQQAPVAVCLQEYRSLSRTRRRNVLRQRERYLDGLAGIVARGQAEGSMDRGFEPRLAALAILGMLNLMSQWYRGDGPMELETIVRFFTTFTVKALTSGPDSLASLETLLSAQTST